MLIRIDGKVIDLDKVTHIYELITVPALRSENKRDETWVFVGANEPIKLTPRKGQLFLSAYYEHKGEPKDITDATNATDNNISQQVQSSIPRLNIKKLEEGIANRLKAEVNV